MFRLFSQRLLPGALERGLRGGTMVLLSEKSALCWGWMLALAWYIAWHGIALYRIAWHRMT